MRLGFLDLPDDERRLFISQAAVQRNISPVVLEKDFWVCWLLGGLFESDFASSLVFKGGTSLSKVFGGIDRFSEDIVVGRCAETTLQCGTCTNPSLPVSTPFSPRLAS